ncbi:zinc finger protein [Cryptosporidium ryanae]|uniref:zinc finger protein n=1 Tax=Cryptosporidium ryanae TaxID=515981 RepID=UPI00351A6CAF|nr:zinc finger protein [Cryptosporidium ryanae]
MENPYGYTDKEKVTKLDINKNTSNKSESSTPSSSFECNICFENAFEPVVTRCGHLYCWNCIYLWLDRGYGDCPVCKAGVTQENVIPLYGRGSDSSDPRKKTKPRPRAERPEPRQREQNNAQRTFQNMEFTFNLSSLPLITIFGNPIYTLIGLLVSQRFFFYELQRAFQYSNNEEFRNKLISNISLFIGVAIMLYLLFIE